MAYPQKFVFASWLRTVLLTAGSIAEARAQHLLAALSPDPAHAHGVGDPGGGRARALGGSLRQGIGLVHRWPHLGPPTCA